MNHRDYVITFVIVLSMLLLSMSFNSPQVFSKVEAQQYTRAERNWEFINHDERGTNSNPQTLINSDNAQFLELKWLFPWPTASGFADSQPGGRTTEGSTAPPLVIDGVIIGTSNMRNTYAIDADSGATVWSHLYKYNADMQNFDELRPGSPHVHAHQFVNDMILTSMLNCEVLAIDAKTGKTKFEIERVCQNVEGNNYNWPALTPGNPGYVGVGKYGLGSHPGAIYNKDNILVVAFAGGDLNWGGRTFMDGYDLDFDPPKRIFRTFLAPPADGDSEWAINACNDAREGGHYFSYQAWKETGNLGVNCKDVPRENVLCDWGCPKHYQSAVTAIWGHHAIDQETGIVYFATGNQASWPNQTFTMGPNLYSGGTIIALDASNGEIVWWYQTTVRDMIEADAPWNTILATIDGRKTIIKATTQGFVFALDAATGDPLWAFYAPFLESRIDADGAYRGRSCGWPSFGGNFASQDGCWNDIRSFHDMQEKRWLTDPVANTPMYWIPVRAGEADIAYDEKTNTIYVPISAGWDIIVNPTGEIGGLGAVPGFQSGLGNPTNTTVYALDASTGEEKWSFFIDGAAFRGGIMVSGNLVIAPIVDGNVYLINAETGELVKKIFLGMATYTQPTIGISNDGKPILNVVSGGRGRGGIGGLSSAPMAIPGGLMAFTIPDVLPEQQVIIERVEVERVVEVEKIVEVPGEERIVEVEKEVEVPVETISPISYVIIGLGVVLVVISGVLYQRGKSS